MKFKHILVSLFAFFSLFLAACAPANSKAPASGSAGSGSAEVVFAGVIESISGDQMTVAGQTFSATASGGTSAFQVGQYVQVRATVLANGEIRASSVAPSSPRTAAETLDASATPEPLATAEASPSPEVSPTPDPLLTPTATPVGSSTWEYTGTLQALTDTNLTLDGQIFNLGLAAIIDPLVQIGSLVKVHVIVNPDGSVTATEVTLASSTATTGWDNGSSPTAIPTWSGGGSTTTSGGNNGGNPGSGGSGQSGGSDDDSKDDDSEDDD